MQNQGRGSTGSEFFFVTGEDAAVLTPQFNVLGLLVSGEESLLRIEQIETAQRPGSREQSLPLETVYVESVTVEVTDS